MNLIVARPEGLYCPPGDFYIDPWRPVARAVITHGHGDHARLGSRRLSLPRRQRADPAPPARRHRRRGRRLWRGRRARRRAASRCIRPGISWARRRSGLNTRARSGSPPATTRSNRTGPARRSSRCAATASSRESTFGLPIYRWRPQAEIAAEINALVAGQRRRRARRAWSSPIRSARRSACWRCSIPPSARSSPTAPSSR